ncbi:MAG: hypothetical protein B6U73_04975 [Desulfurococcales archaeon ex4484_204]|nr:MAG: hypothetical protein B6U73_04975 [Desulfurococcales archaeon ex4484_204]
MTHVVCGDYLVLSPRKVIRNACVRFNERIVEIFERGEGGDEGVTIVSHGLSSLHTHLGLYPIRYSLLNGLELDEWARRCAWPWERALFENPKVSYYSAILALRELVMGGVTLVADMHFNEDIIGRAFKDVGVRGDLSVALLSSNGFNFRQLLESNLDLLRVFKDEELISVRLGPCTPRLLKPGEFRFVVELAMEYGIGIHTHLGEVPEDHYSLVRNYGITLGEFVKSVGLAKVNAIVAHAIWLFDAYPLLARENIYVAHPPRANVLLNDGVANVLEMSGSDINVGLAIDVAPTYRIIDDIRASYCMQYAQLQERMDVEDLWNMATAGYRALNLGSGEVRVGERADIVVWRCRSCAKDLIEPLATLVWGAFEAVDVFVGGKPVLLNGRLARLSSSDINRAFSEVAQFINDLSPGLRSCFRLSSRRC